MFAHINVLKTQEQSRKLKQVSKKKIQYHS